MPSDTAGAARPRPKPTDLDLIAPGRRLLSLKAPRPPRFALHLLDTPNAFRETQRTVRRARELLDLSPSDQSATMFLPEWLRSDPPRGVPWTSYPIVAKPAYAVRISHPVPVLAESGTQPQPCPIDALAERVDTVVVHLPKPWQGPPDGLSELTPDLVLMADRVIASLRPDVGVALVRKEEVVGGRAEFDALVQAHEPALRFRYSYAANFAAIAGPALEHALTTPDPAALAFAYAATTSGPSPDAYRDRVLDRVRQRRPNRHLFHPYALQVLYDLARRGEAPIRPGKLGVVGAPWMTDLVFGKEAEPVWRGTGKYEPVAIPVPLAYGIATALAETLLLRREGDVIRLSDNGKAFLDALHPDCMDLDLPARWRDIPPTAEDGEAMDAWIARRFRRMKTRVNALVEPRPDAAPAPV